MHACDGKDELARVKEVKRRPTTNPSPFVPPLRVGKKGEGLARSTRGRPFSSVPHRTVSAPRCAEVGDLGWTPPRPKWATLAKLRHFVVPKCATRA